MTRPHPENPTFGVPGGDLPKANDLQPGSDEPFVKGWDEGAKTRPSSQKPVKPSKLPLESW